MKTMTVTQFFNTFPDDDACLRHIFDVRFRQGHECPKCKRSAKWSKIKAERAMSCQWCGHHIHPTVGTIFENSQTSLQIWFYAMYLFTITENGVSAKELQRTLGVTYKTAWRIGHKIREHMANVDGEDMLGGPGKAVEADETFVGGHTPNGQGGKGKAVVFGMLEKDGEVMTKVVPARRAENLLPHVIENVAPGSEIHTDEHRADSDLKYVDRYTHRHVNHAAKEYLGRLGETTNAIEGFFSQLKRTIAGTHIHVSPKYLGNYAKECEYRYNRRQNEAGMLPELLSTYPDMAYR